MITSRWLPAPAPGGASAYILRQRIRRELLFTKLGTNSRVQRRPPLTKLGTCMPVLLASLSPPNISCNPYQINRAVDLIPLRTARAQPPRVL